LALVGFYLLLFKSRAAFIKISASLLFLFGVLVLFSLHEYQSILPPSYLQRFTNMETFWTGLFGILLSPSRGLLIFSPYLLLTVFGIYFFFKELIRPRLMRLAILWFFFHLVLIAQHRYWWGGHCFGPRYLTDVFPACILMTILVWDHASMILSHKFRTIILAAFFCFSGISIFINTAQGLYNPATTQWNAGEYTDYLFDWKYPQFMANPKLLKERELEHRIKTGHREIYKTGK
jgi:hypothetical protein